MTARTFFNKAIFKSNLKRFWVGGVLYLIILLFSSGFWTATDYSYHYEYNSYKIPYESFFESLFGMGIAISMIASVVVAVLMFRNVHSKKQSVFHHSLPATRLEGYVSTLLSAFVLMAVPVVITGFFVLAATGQVHSTILWVLLTLLSTFAFLSLASFSALLTGTGWVVFLLYAFFNFIIPVANSFVNSIMKTFALGYTDTIGPLGDFYIYNVLYNIVGRAEGRFTWSGVLANVIVILVSIALYVGAYLLYRTRKMEKCEDISPYKWFNYFFKYTATAFVSLLVFMMFSYDLPDMLSVWVIWSVLLSFVVYFGTEMLLKKKFKVFGAYKGYLVFLIAYAAFFSFFAFTSVFGFETYVPKAEEVQSVIIHNAYSEGGSNEVTDKESLEFVTQMHREAIENKNAEVFHEVARHWYGYRGKDGASFYVTYITEDDAIIRGYVVDCEWYENVMNTLYESEKFRKEYEPIFSLKGELSYVDVRKYINGKSSEVRLYENDMKEFIECLKNDMLSLSYSEIYADDICDIEICSIVPHQDPTVKSTQAGVPDGYYKQSTDLNINKNFTSSVEWLKARGNGNLIEEAVTTE